MRREKGECRPASRPAPRHTIGRTSYRHLATPYVDAAGQPVDYPAAKQPISCRLKRSSISVSGAPEGEAAHVPPQLTLRRPIARQPLPSPTRARKGADRGVRRDRSGLQQGATCGSRRRGAVAIVDVELASDAGALRNHAWRRRPLRECGAIVSLKFFQNPISSIHLLSSGTG